MKKYLLIVLFVIPTFIFGQHLTFAPGAELISQKKQSSSNQTLLNKTLLLLNLTHSFNVLHYKLELDLYKCYANPFPSSFQGINTMTIEADSVISSIVLDAIQTSIVIDSVRQNGVSFTQTANNVTIQLNQTYNMGQTATIKIYYHHLNVSDGAFWVSNDGMLYTDCEPQGARKWFPCWDQPSDKATMELYAKTPANVKLGSNGYLADSVKTVDTIQYHWVSPEPVATYLMVVTSKTNFNLDIVYWHKISNPNDSVPMRFYYNTGENMTNLHNCESLIIPVATLYSQLFCEHPFVKNGFATLNNNFPWGGMENQTLTSFCPDCWAEGLVTHEFAHQWFGDMITCATWTDVWLNEGFATYVEALWDEHAYGYANYKNRIDYYANNYLTNNPGWANADTTWATNTPSTNVLFNYAITYCKGASILHQLRYVLGDTLFFQGLKHYCADTNLKYKSATIPDFILNINQATGQDYSWYFNEWLYQPNHPVYQVSYGIYQQNANLWNVFTHIQQTQASATIYKMPVEFRIVFHDQTDTVVKVMNDVQNQFFWFDFAKQADSVFFDPNNQIVLKEFTIAQSIQQIENDKQSWANISPNPTTANSLLQFQILNDDKISIILSDITGKTIWSKNLQLSKGNHSIPLNATELKSGIYFCRLQSETHFNVLKIIVP
ncbi:MAG: M1 family aminopeptidase [Bacteroidota bacterium]